MATKTFFILASLTCTVLARSINYLPGLEDTFVPLGNEPYKVHTLFKRSAMVEEIMGPLSRNVRQVNESVRSFEVYKVMSSLLSLLRVYVGQSPRIEIFQFQNWDKTIIIDQLFYTKPKTIWEVRRVLNAARSLGIRVRATGAGHSRSPMYVDEGNIMMDVRDLQRHDGPFMQLNQKTRERDYKTVTAMTGVYEIELNDFLKNNDVTVLTQPLNDQETLGGMVAVSTHGTTYQETTWSGAVVEMRLIDSLGRLRRFTIERHPQIMKAAICNLGMFGIMYDITFKVYPMIFVKVVHNFPPLKDLLKNKDALKNLISQNFMTEISWYPFNQLTEKEERFYNSTGRAPSTWNADNDLLWVRFRQRYEVNSKPKQYSLMRYLIVLDMDRSIGGQLVSLTDMAINKKANLRGQLVSLIDMGTNKEAKLLRGQLVSLTDMGTNKEANLWGQLVSLIDMCTNKEANL
ncbi:hypothetical protein Btru_001510 [Bulinus truncatus]|nr:hypothetical protein Btru_001510 [Bulinus truncatus]